MLKLVLLERQGVAFEVINIPQFNGHLINLKNETSIAIPQAFSSIIPVNASISSIYYDDSLLFPNLDASSNLTVASGVTSLQVEGITPGQIFDPPVELTMTLANSSSTYTFFQCSYYNFSTFSWKSDGCKFVSARLNGNVQVSLMYLNFILRILTFVLDGSHLSMLSFDEFCGLASRFSKYLI